MFETSNGWLLPFEPQEGFNLIGDGFLVERFGGVSAGPPLDGLNSDVAGLVSGDDEDLEMRHGPLDGDEGIQAA